MLPDEDHEILRVDAHGFQLQGPTTCQTQVCLRCAEDLVRNFGYPSCNNSKQKKYKQIVEITANAFRLWRGSDVHLGSGRYIVTKAERYHHQFRAARPHPPH